MVFYSFACSLPVFFFCVLPSCPGPPPVRARWGDAPLKALQQLKQMDNMLLGQSERKKLTPEEVEAARLERQQRLERVSVIRLMG